MLIEGEFDCAYCGSPNAITVDAEGGRWQRYVEDCQTCCRPNLLEIQLDEGEGTAFIEASPESD